MANRAHPFLLAAGLLTAGAVLAQTPALQFAEQPKLMSCEPATVTPCFRAKVNIVDEQGQPLGVPLPALEELPKRIKVRAGDSELNPFYVEKAGESQSKVKGRAALIIVDTSGSMKRKLPTGETRFEAAQRAVEHFLSGFQEGADRVAVVPFESHRVEEQIAAAAFVRTREAALQQVRALPLPLETNNTALYSSVIFGLETMQRVLPRLDQEAGEELETMVVILTDGNNEVAKGDDLGLLAGPAGLDQAAAKVKGSTIPVHAIGFSDTGGLDENALRRISHKYFPATDAESLKRVFTITRTLLNDRLAIAFRSPLPDRASLAGRNLPIRLELTLADGRKALSPEAVWTAPQMGVPVYAGKCSPAELKAVLANLPVESGWTSILRPAGVFLGLGLLLLILWHWVPRLIWPDQYLGAVPGAGQKWASQTRVVDGVIAGRPAPPGFEAGPRGVNMGPRGAADKTVVNPQAHPDFSKTRLNNRQGNSPGA